MDVAATVVGHHHVALQSYKAAISLSNIGINMMHYQCFPEATATLRDALELMREAAGPSTIDPFVHEARVHHLLREASGRLSSVLAEDGTSTTTKQDHSPLVTISLLVLSDDLASDFVQTALKAPSELSSEAVVIRIDDDEKEADSITRFQLDSATILFNYATAARCLGATTTNTSYDLSMVARAAHKSYLKAYGILCKTLTSKDYSTSTTDDWQVVRIHLLAMLTVQNLASSALELQMTEKAQEYCHLLGGLQHMYRRIECIPSLLNATRRVAPAA
jgi:hypothetical protein